MGLFSWSYRISLQDFEIPLQGFSSLDQFFTRRLKQGVRPLSGSPLIHPVDGYLTQVGWIENATLVQAKGISYPLAQLIGSDPSPFAGGFYMTYYLCPADYHRVHLAMDGRLTQTTPLGSDLWPVNALIASIKQDLFICNERLVFQLQTSIGPMIQVMVGALNVGCIEARVANGTEMLKGQELGVFHLGSTVILIFPSTAIAFLPDKKLPSLGLVRMGTFQ